MSRLRPFQARVRDGIFAAWQRGARNVLAVAPTGAGKTVIIADVVRSVDAASAVVAHRSELVTQISTALAREGVRHRIVGSDSARKNSVALHLDRFGRSFYDPSARVGVCSVDTLVGKDAAEPWFSQVRLWVCDEAHHLQKDNKWGRALNRFPHAWGLGVTATPSRADGRGLGAESDGCFHSLVVGPGMRELIDSGYLTDYRIFAPPSDVDYSGVTVTDSGDYSPAKLRAAVHASDKLVGDVVSHYLRIARGKLGVTFAVDVDSATELAQGYRAAGVPAEVVSAKTPDLLRNEILKKFERRELLQLVNVDLFGEGFDLPAIEVVSMARKTASWPLYVQQFGRVLRPMLAPDLAARWGDLSDEGRREHIEAGGKPVAIIIDHVGNVIRHGLPDAPREHSLAARERRSEGASDAIPLRTCVNENAGGEGVPCASVYPRYQKCCPFCGFYPEPQSRSAPEFVDGDLYELTPEMLAAMRGKVEVIDGAPRIPQHLDGLAAAGVRKQHQARYAAQVLLREQIALWAGWEHSKGFDDSQICRRFFHAFGVDVLSAQALGRPEAEALGVKIKNVLDRAAVVAA